MTNVYCARDELLKRRVAVKVLARRLIHYALHARALSALGREAFDDAYRDASPSRRQATSDRTSRRRCGRPWIS
jgi:hypothetical protein